MLEPETHLLDLWSCLAKILPHPGHPTTLPQTPSYGHVPQGQREQQACCSPHYQPRMIQNELASHLLPPNQLAWLQRKQLNRRSRRCHSRLHLLPDPHYLIITLGSYLQRQTNLGWD